MQKISKITLNAFSLFLTAIITTLIFSSCAKGSITMFFRNDKSLAEARMAYLFHAIKQQNKDDIKKAFSKKAVAESNNLSTDIEDLLSFVQGEAISWERNGGPVVSDSVEDVNTQKRLVTWFYLDTDEQKYMVLLIDYPVDTFDSENEGLYAMRILKAEDTNKLVGTTDDWEIPGIYIMDN